MDLVAIERQERENDFHTHLFDQIFQNSITLKESTLLFHYNAEKAIHLTKDKPKLSIEISEFTRKDTVISYASDDDTKGLTKNEKPIIVVPFPANPYQFVIDGNHRLLDTIRRNGASIEYTFLNCYETVTLFPNNFEKAFYLFLHDVSVLSTELANPSGFEITKRKNLEFVMKNYLVN